MTKKAIIRKQYGRNITPSMMMLNSMDEFAKQQAIAFAKFAMEFTSQDMNVLDLDGHPDKWCYSDGEISNDQMTTDELYALFLEHQSKQK